MIEAIVVIVVATSAEIVEVAVIETQKGITAPKRGLRGTLITMHTIFEYKFN